MPSWHWWVFAVLQARLGGGKTNPLHLTTPQQRLRHPEPLLQGLVPLGLLALGLRVQLEAHQAVLVVGPLAGRRPGRPLLK